jgi:hypothetical protein
MLFSSKLHILFEYWTQTQMARPCGCEGWHLTHSRWTRWRRNKRKKEAREPTGSGSPDPGQAHQDQHAQAHQDHRDQDRAPSADREACHSSAGTVWTDAVASGNMTLPITVEALILIGLAITVLHCLTMLPHPNKAPNVVEFGRVLRDLSSRMAPLKIHMCIHECKVYREGDNASTCIICRHARFFRKKLPYHVLAHTRL